LTRIGVIGCGKIAEKHLAAYRKLDVDIVVSDIVERGRMVAENYGAEWCPDPDELLSDPTVAAVDVCTPTPTHADFIIRALDEHKHAFCEKPLARNLEEAEAIRRKAEENGCFLMVGYLYRFHPAFQFAREIVREGIIGDPYFATLRLGGRGSHKAWKHKAETGGGAANEMLIHMLDLALWYFGEPAGVENLYTDTILSEREVEGELVQADAEDIVVLKLLHESGVTSLCESDLLTPGYMNHVEIQGSNGSILTSILDYVPTCVYCKEERGVFDRGQNFREFGKVDLFERELGHFLAVINGEEREAVNSVHDSVRLMQVVEAAQLVQAGLR
jgi:myo-inositol 2-dehydrogenase / D-chiro-inositol 1-dehydrogenase